MNAFFHVVFVDSKEAGLRVVVVVVVFLVVVLDFRVVGLVVVVDDRVVEDVFEVEELLLAPQTFLVEVVGGADHE